MCNRSVDNYSGVLEFVPECYKAQKMCDKAVNFCPTISKNISECYETQEMCKKVVHRWFSFHSISE